jgi:hypothetical protein
MLSSTDSALDFLVLKLVLHASHLDLLLLRILAPVDAGLENDVLADGRCVHSRSCLVLRREAKFAPSFAFRHTRVDDLLHNGCADPARRLDLLAFIVDTVCDDSFRSILVGRDLLRWQLEGGIIKLFIISPVGAALEGLVGFAGSKHEHIYVLCYFRGHVEAGFCDVWAEIVSVVCSVSRRKRWVASMGSNFGYRNVRGAR